MDIGVAGHTFCFCIGKEQRFVALPAVQNLMLPYQGEAKSVMVKCKRFSVNLPAFGGVAITAVGAEIFSVRGLCEGHAAQYNQRYY